MDSAIRHKIATDRFWPLPRPNRADGTPRRTGVEIEFTGLTVRQAAEALRDLWGGQITGDSDDALRVLSNLGEMVVKLDTALTADGPAGFLREVLGELVPVEVITPPLRPAEMPQTDRLARTLRAVGARGTRDGFAFGFGVHLNPEVAAETADAIMPTVRAFALIEDWLRASDPVDPARRLLPFVDAWPRRLVDLLAAEGGGWSLGDLSDAYVMLSPTRNRALDLLPLLEHVDPERVRRALPEGQARGGRPTWHYRLPEARVDEPDWSIAYEWNRWCIVERVAARPDLLETLARGWQDHRAALTTLRGDWALRVEAMLWDAEIWQQ
jgi:hypothetical protein